MACSGCGPGGCNAHKRDENFDPDLEGPSDADIEKFGTNEIECPECGASVYFDVPLCPRCGHAMSGADRSKAAKQTGTIIALGAALALIGFIVVSVL